MSAAAFRSLLEAGDVDGLREAWARVAPHLPQPETREQAEITMHHARTGSEGVTFRARAYSHRWLTERAFPSALPDVLKPKAERMFPVVADAVGISVSARNEILQPVAQEIEQAMAVKVEEMYADGDKDPSLVKSQIMDVRERTWRKLMGAKQ